jgi:hypothetical protein
MRGAVACGTRLVGSYPSPADRMLAEINANRLKNMRSSTIRAHKSLRDNQSLTTSWIGEAAGGNVTANESDERLCIAEV